MEAEAAPSKPQTIVRQEPASKPTVTGVDEYFGIEPQVPFLSNCHISEDPDASVNILAWNMVGIVSLRKETNYTSVDVEFNDKSMH